MKISIDITSATPVFMQLIDQIRDGVTRGELVPGTPLPTIRQLATDLKLNPNTVAKAYRLLERDTIIETLGRRGSFIHREASEHSQIDLGSKAQAAMADVVNELREIGLTDSEIRNAFGDAMNTQLKT